VTDMTPAHLRSQRPALSLSFGTTRVAILDSDYILNQVARLVDDPVRAFSLIGPPFRRGRTFASAHVLSAVSVRQTGLCQQVGEARASGSGTRPVDEASGLPSDIRAEFLAADHLR